ncbi:hypothetical protein ACJX0J_027913, partial [Zea mays]
FDFRVYYQRHNVLHTMILFYHFHHADVQACHVPSMLPTFFAPQEISRGVVKYRMYKKLV